MTVSVDNSAMENTEHQSKKYYNPQWQELAAQNHNLIYGLLHRDNLPIEDFYDIAAIGLCHAAQTWHGPSAFAIYAYAVMHYSCCKEIERESALKRGVNGTLNVSYEESTGSIEHGSTDVEQEAMNAVIVQQIAEYIHENCTEAQVMYFELFQTGLKHKDIAECLGLSRFQAMRMRDGMWDMVRKHFRFTPEDF